jgi:hypothetical protein
MSRGRSSSRKSVAGSRVVVVQPNADYSRHTWVNDLTHARLSFEYAEDGTYFD